MSETHIELIPFKTFPPPCKTETLAKREDTLEKGDATIQIRIGNGKKIGVLGLITNRTVPQRRGMITRRRQKIKNRKKKAFLTESIGKMETEAQWSKGVFPFLSDSSFLSRSDCYAREMNTARQLRRE